MDGFNNLFAQAPSYLPGLLSEEEIAQLQQQSRQAGLVNLGLSLLSSAGPSPQRQGLGQMLAQGVMAGQQASRNAYEQAVKDKMLQEQIAEQQQARQEALAARQILPTLIRQPRQEIYGEDIMGQRVGEGVKIGAPELDVASLAKLFATAPGVATKVLPSVEAFRKLTELQQFDLPEGTTRYQINRETGKPEVIAGGPKPQVTKPAGSVLEAMQVLGINVPVDQLSEEQRKAINSYIERKTERGAAKLAVDMTQGQKGYENLTDLKKQFGSEPIYKEFAGMQTAYSQVTSAIQQGTPIADTAAATKIMKLLDPGSVVRETELGMAMAATGKLDRLKYLLTNYVSGNKLTPQQRVEFQGLADELYNAAATAYNSKRGEYEQIGRRFNLDPDLALGKPAEIKSRKSIETLRRGE